MDAAADADGADTEHNDLADIEEEDNITTTMHYEQARLLVSNQSFVQ